MSELDLIVHGASAVVTPLGQEARGGSRFGEVEQLAGVAVACDAGRIVGIGPEAELRADTLFRDELDARGGLVVPGFVDAHTHPVFLGTREDEFEMRNAGRSYLEISRCGGGILASMRGVRESSSETLLRALLQRLDRFLELGTTTIEAKTGYGLTPEDELKCLRVIEAAGELHSVELVPTFLGAHDFPPEYKDRPQAYVDLLVDKMLPMVAESGLAEYCDIFTEGHVFDLDSSRRILGRAADLGLGLRLHVDQLTPLGGAQLAAEVGAQSADHLEHVSEAGIDALAAAQVIPVLCPLVPLYLGESQEAPGRRMVSAGLAPAIATDFNPGSCYTQSLPEVLSWAALRFGFTAAESLCAATLNAACSLNRGARLGTVEVGKQADLAILDLPNLTHLTYEIGRNPVRAVVKHGRTVFQKRNGLLDSEGSMRP